MEQSTEIISYTKVLEFLALVEKPILLFDLTNGKIIYANPDAEHTYTSFDYTFLESNIDDFIQKFYPEIHPKFIDKFKEFTESSTLDLKIDNFQFVNKLEQIVQISIQKIVFMNNYVGFLQIEKLGECFTRNEHIFLSNSKSQQQILELTIKLNQAEHKNLEYAQKITSLENIKQKLQSEILRLQEQLSTTSLNLTSLSQEIEILKEQYKSKISTLENEIISKNKEISRIKNEYSNYTNLQSIILANLGHELRTPLNGILGFVQLIEMEELPPQIYDDLQMIKRSANRLKSTLDNLLLLSEIDSKEKQVQLVPFKLEHIKDFIDNSYYEKAVSKKISFEVKVHNPEANILIDPDLMQIVFDSLLDNAFKFTQKGFVRIETEDFTANNSKYILIKFKDSGCGIPRDKLDIVFKPFRQASEGYEREYQGIGIGLTIAKKLLELMDCEIGLKSIVDKGSTFIIQAPIVEH